MNARTHLRIYPIAVATQLVQPEVVTFLIGIAAEVAVFHEDERRIELLIIQSLPQGV